MYRLFLALLTSLLAQANQAHTQSFFANLVIDPVVGVDRGSASVFMKVNKPTRYTVLSNSGSEPVGPYLASFGYSHPNLAREGDQFDISLIASGPSEDGKAELLAGGIGYRTRSEPGEFSFFSTVDFGDARLGTVSALDNKLQGQRVQYSAGLRYVQMLGETAKLWGEFSVIGRDIRSDTRFGPLIDESLRMVRASALYSNGTPLAFQQRATLSATVGLPGLGASQENNPLSSIPGATSNFFRVSSALEASIPLSNKWLTNIGIIGQWTNDSLPASQRCGFGTNSYARAFDYSTVTGDRCYGTRVELAYNVEPPGRKQERFTFSQAYIGIDGGKLEDLTNPSLPGKSDSWSSLSVGIRTLRGDFIAEASFTHALEKPNLALNQDDNRLWIRAAIRF